MLGYVLGATLVLAVLSPLFFTETFADSFVVNFDKQFFDVGDSLTISGEIMEIWMPVIAMSIYDPDGKIASANNLEISSEKTFVKTIVLDSPVYEKIGEYQIKLDYGKVSENYYFVLENESFDSETIVQSSDEIAVVQLNTEKKQYSDNEIIKINGLVSVLDSPSVLIGIYDPFGTPVGFYFGMVDFDLKFVTSFLVKDGVNFRVDGTYSIKAHYAESEFVSFFEYSKDSHIVVEDVVVEDVVVEDVVVEDVVVEDVVVEDVVVEDVVVEDVVVEDVVVEDVVVEDVVVEETNDKIKKLSELSLKDVVIGKSLNQINLKCDSSIYTDIISYYDGMGPALYRLCEFSSALGFFNESLLDDTDDIEILVNKGSTLGKLGYFSEAIVYYDYVIDIDPNFLPAKNNKANALANMKNLDSAILLYNEILTQAPDHQIVQKNLMIAQSLIGSLSEDSLESNFQNLSYSNSLMSDNFTMMDSEKQKPRDFFDEISIAFSTLGSLFDFLN